MSNYVLNKNDIRLLLKLNFSLDFTRRRFKFIKDYKTGEECWENPDEYISSQKPEWDRVFFNPLLSTQPDLKPLVENFWEKSKHEQYIEWLGSAIFQDKIYLKSIYPMIFNEAFGYSGTTERIGFIKKMVNQEQWLMDELHKHIIHKVDTATLKAYIELLPCHVNQIKDSKESIWKNLSKSKNFPESSQIKMLNVTIRSFLHDKSLYDFLINYFTPKFEHQHTLRETFNKYENKYFSSFKKNEQIDFFPSFQKYSYVLSIKDSILIDHFGVHKNIVGSINKQIIKAIESNLHKEIGEHLLFSYSAKGLEVSSTNFQEQSKIEKYMDKIKKCVYDVLTSLDETLKKNPDEKTINELFDKALLHCELNEKLEVNSDTKIIRRKI